MLGHYTACPNQSQTPLAFQEVLSNHNQAVQVFSIMFIVTNYNEVQCPSLSVFVSES